MPTAGARIEFQSGSTGSFSFAQGIVFTGHRIDAPDRPMPRFPARAESAARAAIRAAVAALLREAPGCTVAVAGGACGGDILFHEVCRELAVPARMLLAVPPAEFIESSVAQGGPPWVDRFRALMDELGPGNVRIMTAEDGLLEGPTPNLWQRSNLWLVQEIIRLAPVRTLLALWDGQSGDGPGGTEHLVEVAPRYGLRIAPIISVESLVV